MEREKYSLTDEHRAQLKPWADKWIAIALRTEPQTEEDRRIAGAGISGTYAAAKLDLPPAHRCGFVASPMAAAIASGVAAGVWYLRENPGKGAEIAGRGSNLTETQLARAAVYAVEHCTAAGMAEIVGDPDAPHKGGLAAAKNDAARGASDATAAAMLRAISQDGSMPRLDKRAKLVPDLVWFFADCAARSWSMRNGGNQWAGWCAFLSFFDRVVGLDLPEYANWRHYEAAAMHSGPRYMHSRFWIASDFPTVVGRDDRDRAHSLAGPQLAWRDGWEVYMVHGVRVPRHVVAEPNRITIAEIDGQENAEVRRVMIEQYGPDRFIADGGAVVVDRDADPQVGTLWRRELANDEPLCLLEVENSTPEGLWSGTVFTAELRDGKPHHKRYWLRVPQTCKTARDANAWTWGLQAAEYRPGVQT